MDTAMNSRRWRRIEEVFRTALDRPTQDREAFLTRVCGDDEDLRHQVTSLLACETTDDFIQGTILNAAATLVAEPRDDLSGALIGPYRVKRLIGRGGMGAVYEAERDDEHFQQQVALKIIKRGMDSDFIRNRFVLERQILASLDHPHIARLFDGGATPDGQPYFVMEFVDGEPITAYCQRHALSLHEKLALFREVCAAVQHAHQKLVVHRDLKPSNILITDPETGGAGTPKLLDFGIAKWLTPEGGQDVYRTMTAFRMMTPDYASPEQVRGLPVATTTDVYSLGVVLYELLTGRRPHEFAAYTPAEIDRVICETEVEPPSKVVRQKDGARTRLARHLEGDLDNIALMALRKEPERRYQSVEQFSEDLRRYLKGLPIAARKDTLTYRTGKFVRRHKAGVAIVALLVLQAVMMTFLAASIARERDRANREAATAEAVIRSLQGMYEIADPGKAGGHVITARELLDQGAEKAVRGLRGQPVAQARLMDTTGQLYRGIGLFDRAQPLLEEALTLRRGTLGPEHPDVATSLTHLAEVLNEKGEYERCESLLRESLQMRRKLLGPEHPDIADSEEKLGSMLVTRGKLREAEPLLRDALAMRRKLLGEESREVAESLTGLGRLQSEQGQFHQAELTYRQTLSIRRKLFGSEHALVATALNNLAAMLQEQGDYKGAEEMFRESLAIRRKLYGDEHPESIVSLANLASALQDTGKVAESEQAYRRVLELRRRLLGPEHPRLATTMNNLATLLRDRGAYDEAMEFFRQALAIRRKNLGEDHPEVGATLNGIGVLLYLKGAYAQAEAAQRQAIEIYQKTLPPTHWSINRSRSNLGACLIKLKRYREAETELLQSHAALKAAQGESHANTVLAANRLADLYTLWGKPAQAASYRVPLLASAHLSKK